MRIYPALRCSLTGNPTLRQPRPNLKKPGTSDPAIRLGAQMRTRTLTLLLLCLLPGNAWAKCARSAIVIDGLISGPTAGSSVFVEVVPTPNWNSERAVVIDSNGRFHVTVYFDTYSGEGWLVYDKCLRSPASVTIRLYRNKRLLDQVALEIKQDFVRQDKIDFRLRSPVILHSH